jgi:hypothetical protein
MARLPAAMSSLASTVDVSDAATHRLGLLDLAMGLAHGLQGLAMILLSNDVSLPVTAAFATGQPGRSEQAPALEELFRYRLGIGVALFSLLSSAFHLLVASPWGFRR